MLNLIVVDSSPAPDSDWPERFVVLWEEGPGREHPAGPEPLSSAFLRITGVRLAERKVQRRVEGGEVILELCHNGWVTGFVSGLGFVAKVAKIAD